MKSTCLIAAATMLASANHRLCGGPVGTIFTYQGQLSAGSKPANGYYDFSFRLFDAETGGTQFGPGLNLAAVALVEGQFTVSLDFGNVFDGNARWLSIGVKTNGAGSYTGLTPRQPLTATPYAVYAPEAGSASRANSVAAGAVTGAGLAGGAVGTTSLAPGAVTTLGLADNSVTAAKLASDPNSLARVSGARLAISGNNALQVDGTNLVNANADGLVNIGHASGSYLSLDGDDIQAKGGSGVAPLYLNYWGGDTYIGNQGAVLQAKASGVGIGAGPGDSKLSVQGQMRLNDSNIVFRSGGDLNHGVGWREKVGDSVLDGPFLYGYNGGALGVSGPETVALTWNYKGNVSISNNLTVGDELSMNQLIVDSLGTNAGSLSPGITFGSGSGEGISSRRLSGGNQYGLDFYTGFQPRMLIDNSGNVAINAAAANGYRLYVNGAAFSTGGWSGSDLRWKKNVQPITQALGKVARLRGVSYDWRRDEFPEQTFEDGKPIGFIAQEVEQVLPEAVRTDANGYKAIAYEKLTAVLAEGIKEQQSEIETLKTQNAALQKSMAELTALIHQSLAKPPN